MSCTIGLDLGGTDIKGGLLDEHANVLAQHTISTEALQGPDHVIGRIAELAETLAERAEVKMADVRGVGIGVPGPIDPRTECVISAPNLSGWKQIPLRKKLSALLEPEVRVYNDANAAAYGEFWAGAGKDLNVRYLIMLTLGTGVGGGVILDGHLYIGPHGAGAELGHCIVEPLGPLCSSGERGSLEVYASATAITEEVRRRMAAGVPTKIPNKPSCKDVFDAAEAGDALAAEVVDRAAFYLGVACVNLVRVFDPQMIVLGGGVARAGKTLLEPVRRHFVQRNWTIRQEVARIELAELGNDAGFIGAAGMIAADLNPLSER